MKVSTFFPEIIMQWLLALTSVIAEYKLLFTQVRDEVVSISETVE